MKFCYNTNSALPKQCQSSRSVLQDGSRTFGLFWKEKKPRLITEEIRYLEKDINMNLSNASDKKG